MTDLSALGTSHKRDHIIRGPLRPASFSEHHVFKDHPRCSRSQNFISFLPLFEYYSLVQLDSVVFLHSSGDGRWSCFHILAVVNDAPVLEHLSSVLSLHTPAWRGRGLRVMGGGNARKEEDKRRKERGRGGKKK